MRAMVLPAPGAPLQMQERQDPLPGDGQIRVKVSACGVCRTETAAFPLVETNEVLSKLRSGQIFGAAALRP